MGLSPHTFNHYIELIPSCSRIFSYSVLTLAQMDYLENKKQMKFWKNLVVQGGYNFWWEKLLGSVWRTRDREPSEVKGDCGAAESPRRGRTNHLGPTGAALALIFVSSKLLLRVLINSKRFFKSQRIAAVNALGAFSKNKLNQILYICGNNVTWKIVFSNNKH